MPDALLAIDPGTYRTGYAIFKDGIPDLVGTFEADKRQTADQRATAVITFVVGLLALEPDISLVVCEQWLGPRNPQLQTLITALGQTVKKMGIGWQLYHNSKVMAAVRPKGYRVRTSEERKIALRDGVLGIYPELRFKLIKYHLDRDSDVLQDAIDAVAVGVCHMGAEKVKWLEGTVGHTHTNHLSGGRQV